MKTKVLIILVLLFASCNDIDIPDKIEVGNLEKKFKCVGTNLIIDKPDDYEYSYGLRPTLIKQLINRENVRLLINEQRNLKNFSVKESSQKTIDILNGEVDIDYSKNFKIGEYDANLIIYSNTKKEYLIFKFGNSSMVVSLLTDIPKGNEIIRKEIIELMLSSYVMYE